MMPRHAVWIDLSEALERLSLQKYQKHFCDLHRQREAKTVFRWLEELLLKGDIEAFIYIDGRAVSLSQADMLTHPFGIHFQLDNSPGVETTLNRDRLVSMRMRESDLQRAIDVPSEPARVVELTTNQTHKQRMKAFQEYLEGRMRADDWMSKRAFQKEARDKFAVLTPMFRSIWTESVKKTGVGWSNRGRRRK
jgi:hypothetical protein